MTRDGYLTCKKKQHHGVVDDTVRHPDAIFGIIVHPHLLVVCTDRVCTSPPSRDTSSVESVRTSHVCAVAATDWTTNCQLLPYSPICAYQLTNSTDEAMPWDGSIQHRIGLPEAKMPVLSPLSLLTSGSDSPTSVP